MALRTAGAALDCVLDLDGTGDMDGLMHYAGDDATCIGNGVKSLHMCGEAQGWECWQGSYWCSGDNVYEDGVEVRIEETDGTRREFATWREFAHYVLSR